MSELFAPEAHEATAGEPWSEAAARAAIAEIAADAEDAFDPDGLWRSHPLDEDGEPLPPVKGLYLGAGGVIWALDALRRLDAIELRRDWADVATGLLDRYAADPDLPEWTDGKPVPSLLAGESGLLLAAHRLSPAPWQADRMVEAVRANAQNPTRELLWGSPGTMLAAQLLYEETGDARLADAWQESADWLWDEWRGDLWRQEMYGSVVHYVGPGHGFAGNVHVLARGDLLDAERRAELERRALATLASFAERDGNLAQWQPTLEPSRRPQARRTQWCHGAPGMVISFATIVPDDAELTDLLVAGGELTWTAGPLTKGPGLCHGTAGNGYAFLKLLDRTGDERWLERARAFAMHAAAQVRRARSEYGMGRHNLFTGDIGVALYLQACIDVAPAMPIVDWF